ncbi:hypothetical protein RHSIM_Rhsim11G0181900 [Rhododendron simsii]|uniref:Uncharacterized protein n=1 Tax=Rhododendron simsii TaxID=118357 RepID=A0A834L9R0_RHOSS|nr:hypothetical protein RHSIM_Rhsim11G0181900 [Rhododendron simsii]
MLSDNLIIVTAWPLLRATTVAPSVVSTNRVRTRKLTLIHIGSSCNAHGPFALLTYKVAGHSSIDIALDFLTAFTLGDGLMPNPSMIPARSERKCGSSFCYKCGEKVYAHRCNCKDKANDEDTTNNEDTAASITEYVQFKNEEERVAGIKCPGSNCDKLLDPFTCPALVPPEVSYRCYCPNRVCSAVVVTGEGVWRDREEVDVSQL